MMTELESAVYLAWQAITERYPEMHNLSFDEKQEYYRELIRRLQRMLPEGKAEEQFRKAYTGDHECCGGCNG